MNVALHVSEGKDGRHTVTMIDFNNDGRMYVKYTSHENGVYPIVWQLLVDLYSTQEGDAPSTWSTYELTELIELLQEELDKRDDEEDPPDSPSLEDEGKSLGSYES